jgi:hypothetical protein
VVTTRARLGLASFVAEVHRLATGQPLTITEAREYFRNPRCLADTVKRSGLLSDPQRRQHLDQLLAAQGHCSHEESAHGL